MSVELPTELIEGLNVALNEATLLGVKVVAEQRVATIALSVLSMPDKGQPSSEVRVELVLQPVGRVAASLRHGRWDDAAATVEPFGLDGLPAVLSRVGGCAMYGWKFFDVPEGQDFDVWKDRLSLDWRSSDSGGMSHSLILFQENKHHLDLCIWFDELSTLTPSHHLIPLDDFAAGGKRWWDGMYAGDPRTSTSGIVPLRAEATKTLRKALDELDS